MVDVWIVELESKKDNRETTGYVFFEEDLPELLGEWLSLFPDGRIKKTKRIHIRGASDELLDILFDMITTKIEKLEDELYMLHEQKVEEKMFPHRLQMLRRCSDKLGRYRKVGRYIFKLDDERRKK